MQTDQRCIEIRVKLFVRVFISLGMSVNVVTKHKSVMKEKAVFTYSQLFGVK